MDAEELRKSQRRLKGGKPHNALGRQLSSKSSELPSQESDIDDDEAMECTPTTPSADNADRSMSSVFSVRYALLRSSEQCPSAKTEELRRYFQPNI